MFLEKPELIAFSLLLDLLAEFLQLLLLPLVLLLRLPYVLYVPEAPRVPSLLVQELQRHFLSNPCPSLSPSLQVLQNFEARGARRRWMRLTTSLGLQLEHLPGRTISYRSPPKRVIVKIPPVKQG